MLNIEKVKELFESADVDDNQVFAYKDNLTFDFNVKVIDVRVSDSKGNEICIYHNGNGINKRVWADKVSKKLDKAINEIESNIATFYIQ